MVDFDRENYPVFITKYMKNGNLAQILKWKRSHGSSEFNNTKMIINILGISLGMKYMHENKIVNRELKPANVLLDSNLYPKITDFGTSRIIDESTVDLTTAIGTPLYMAPEVCEDDGYSFEVDVFSFGMILYEFYTGHLPTIKGCKTTYHVVRKIIDGERPDERKLPGGPINELIKRCWSGDPKKRPSFNEIIFEFIVHRKKYWPEDVDDSEVEDYLAKFGLSLDSDKKSIYAIIKIENKKDDDDDDYDDDDKI